MRKIVILTSLALAIPLLTLRGDNGQGAGEAQPKAARPAYVHSVIFYLKKDADPAKLQSLIADCHNVLGKIPSVRGLWVGRPAEKGTPDFAVKDYNLGLLVLFDNYDGLKAYGDDPTHLKLVDTYMPHLEKLVVYDFIDQAK